MENLAYRDILKEVFIERSRRNPSYSLRAMARQLGVAPSSLSEILKGKKNLSKERAADFATKLNFDSKKADLFCDLVELESSKAPLSRQRILDRLNAKTKTIKFYDLSLDQFRLISDWYHAAIVEMSALDAADMRPQSISHKLGISEVEAEMALERLARLKILAKDKSGSWKKSDEHFFVESNTPNEALQSFHRQMLLKAIDSLKNQGPKEKIIRTETLGICKKDLPKFEALLDKFFEDVISLAAKSKSKNEVYHLGCQFFSVGKGEEE